MREQRPDPGVRNRWLPVAPVVACIALAVAASPLRGSAERRVGQPDQRPFATARADRMAHGCWGRPVAAAAATCVFGDPTGTVTVALFGDSHAEHWLAALDRLGRARGWRVVLMVKGGCPVADAPELIGAGSNRHGRECARYREAVIRKLIALQPAVAVLSSYDEYVTRDVALSEDRAPDGRVSPGAWGRGLRRTYTRLAHAGVPVVAIRGTPYPGFDVPACLSRRAAGLPMADACEYVRDEALHLPARTAQLTALRDVSSRGLPVTAVDMAGEVCSAPSCSAMRGGRVVFTDGNHLTAGFTRAAAGALGARLDAALATIGVRLP